ncbi:MAG: nuclear transport factor 2 family protein [Candidatus Limnocylindrales bacterium]
MSDGPRAVAEAYWRDEGARDIDAVMSHYHPDAAFTEPGGRKRVGHAEIRDYYEASAAAYPGLWVEITAEVIDGDRGALEWIAELTDQDGTRIPARGVNMVEVRDGKFTSVRSYFDTRAIP